MVALMPEEDKPDSRLARAHVFISGMVQGVFFRAHTRTRANFLNIKGWVRNTTTGGVEAVFEGEKENVEKIIEFCKKGPYGADVESIDVKWEKFRAEFKDFKIKY